MINTEISIESECDVENHVKAHRIRIGVVENNPGERNHPLHEDSESVNETKCYVVPSNKKNGILLSVDGFLFNKNKIVNGKYYWECNQRKHKKACENIDNWCTSKAISECLQSGDHRLLKMSNHNHTADASEANVKTARSEIKKKATESRIKPCQIIQDVNCQIDVNIQPFMPNKPAQRKIISRERHYALPKEPKVLDDLNIPDDLRNTITGEMFLLREITVGDDFILIFSTRNNIRRLAQSEHWMGDGTFKTVPDMFLQLYTIHAPVGRINDVTVPLVYSLLTSKKSEIYEQLFINLNELAYEFECELSPKFILTDFEIGAVNSFKREFPGAVMKGCYFHLGQSIYRQIQSLGLATKYGTDIEFSLKVRQVYALAFLAPSEIPDAFKKLKETAASDSDLLDFMSWFENNYVLGRLTQKRKRTRRNSLEIRSPPLFPPSLWSVYENTTNAFPRVTNKVETWHRRWNTIIGAAHVGTHFLIKEIIKEEHKVNGDIERMIAGFASAPKKKDLVKREERISLILRKKNDDSDILEFLKGLAYNLSF